MAKKRYIVNTAISYLTDLKIISRMLAGEDVPYEDRIEKRAEVGDIVDDLPPSFVIDLLHYKQITPIEEEEIKSLPIVKEIMTKKEVEIND